MDTINTLIEKINTKIGDSRYYYISNFIDHAQGFENWIKNFKAVCLWNSAYTEYLKHKDIDVFCFNTKVQKQGEVKTSAQLLDFIIDNNLIDFEPGSYYQTFKVSPRFFTLISKLNGEVINTSDDLNRLFESKVSQAEIFDKYGLTFPKTIITKLKDLTFQQAQKLFGDIFVVQFNRGHTGNGTIFVKEKEQYLELQQKFPQRIVRISEYIDSPTYTLNGCVSKKGTYLGGLCKQISGIKELSADIGGTVGNNYVHGLTNTQIWDLIDEINKLNKAFKGNGYMGMFGIDFMLKDNKVNVLEINARQTMSVPFHSSLQESKRQIPLILLHISEFLDVDYDVDLESYNLENTAPMEAAQLILRNTDVHLITLQNEIKSGEYTLEGNNLIYRNPELYIDKIEKDNLIIMSKLKGTQIQVGEEIARIQLKKNLYIDNNLDSFYVNLLLRLKSKLISA